VPLRLVVMQTDTQRLIRRQFIPGAIVSFADGYPILLIGQESLSDLNSRLDTPILMNRFRPNIVTVGAAAFEEDNWKEIHIGSEVMHGVSDCSRCMITTINQESAETSREPLRTLAGYRLVDQEIMFGRNIIPETTGCIHVGDSVQVLSRVQEQ
jgi:uncharacterized protein